MKGFCRSISIMPPRESLTRKQKGKAPVSKSPPNVDLDEIHRDAPVNTLNLYFSQHLLVVDAIEQFRAEDGRQDARNDLLILICYYPGGIFSRERVLNPELIRPSKIEGQDWERLGVCGSYSANAEELGLCLSSQEMTRGLGPL